MNKILLVYDDYTELMAVESALIKVGFDVVSLTNEYGITEQVLGFNPDLVIGSGTTGKVTSLGVGKRLKDLNRWTGKAILIFSPGHKPQPDDLIRIRMDMVLESPVPVRRLIQVAGKLLNHDEVGLLEKLDKALEAGGARFSLDGEAIYIQGNTDSADKGLTLRSERVDEDSQNFSLSPEEQVEKKKISFRFGDRISEEHTVVSGKADSADNEVEVAFGDVDLQDLEAELLGKAPVVESEIAEAVAEALPEDRELAQIQAKAREDLDKSAENLRERVEKYQALVADVKVSPKSTITRTEAKQRQRQISASWDFENLNKLDKLRQEFAKALFKK